MAKNLSKLYIGKRFGPAIIDPKRVSVEVDGSKHDLSPRTDLCNHSPDGFNWGYGGSGPAQLALAILADFLQNDEKAIQLYQKFKFRVIASIQENEWQLSGDDIEKELLEIEREID